MFLIGEVGHHVILLERWGHHVIIIGEVGASCDPIGGGGDIM